LFNQAGLTIIDSQICGRIPPNKTPEPIFGVLKRLPHKGGRFTSISVAVIGAKGEHHGPSSSATASAGAGAPAPAG
jgi:hypothetical protein